MRAYGELLHFKSHYVTTVTLAQRCLLADCWTRFFSEILIWCVRVFCIVLYSWFTDNIDGYIVNTIVSQCQFANGGSAFISMTQHEVSIGNPVPSFVAEIFICHLIALLLPKTWDRTLYKGFLCTWYLLCRDMFFYRGNNKYSPRIELFFSEAPYIHWHL